MPVFLNLKAFLRRRLFLVPIAVSFAASVIGVTLIANVYAMREAKREQLNEDCRAYVVELRDASTLEEALPALKSRQEVTRVMAAGRDGDTVFFANVYGEPPARRYMVSMGHYFETDSDEIETAQVVLPTEEADEKKLRVGDRYPLCGQDFTIIGIGFDHNGIEIPYTALKDRSGLFAVSVVTKESGTLSEQNAFGQFLEELFHVQEVEQPPEASDAALTAEDAMLLLVLILGILSISFLYVSYLESRRQTFAIYTLVGCRKSQLICMLCEEMALLIAGLYMVAFLLIKLLFWTLSVLDIGFVEVLTVREYLWLFLIILAWAFFTFALQMPGFFRKTPDERSRVL